VIFRQTLRISVADPEAKAAYDRIASANFTKHACRATPKEQKPSHEGPQMMEKARADADEFLRRIREGRI